MSTRVSRFWLRQCAKRLVSLAPCAIEVASILDIDERGEREWLWRRFQPAKNSWQPTSAFAYKTCTFRKPTTFSTAGLWVLNFLGEMKPGLVPASLTTCSNYPSSHSSSLPGCQVPNFPGSPRLCCCRAATSAGAVLPLSTHMKGCQGMQSMAVMGQNDWTPFPHSGWFWVV